MDMFAEQMLDRTGFMFIIIGSRGAMGIDCR